MMISYATVFQQERRNALLKKNRLSVVGLCPSIAIVCSLLFSNNVMSRSSANDLEIFDTNRNASASTDSIVNAEGDKTLAEADLPLKNTSSCPDFLNRNLPKLHSRKTINPCQLGDHKAILVVNTASHCGFTPQFKGLESLHQAYKDKGLLVLGFPSDDFFQEADSESETAEVCYTNYGVTFPMFKTVKVRGKSADPVFQAIAQQGSKPKWNFYKFLINSEGKLIKSFSSKIKPDDEKFLTIVHKALAI